MQWSCMKIGIPCVSIYCNHCWRQYRYSADFATICIPVVMMYNGTHYWIHIVCIVQHSWTLKSIRTQYLFFRFFKECTNVATAAPAHEFTESEVLHDFGDNVPPLKSMWGMSVLLHSTPSRTMVKYESSRTRYTNNHVSFVL